MIFSAVLAVRCRVLRSEVTQLPKQTVMQVLRELTVVPLYYVVRMGDGRWTFLCGTAALS